MIGVCVRKDVKVGLCYESVSIKILELIDSGTIRGHKRAHPF